MKSHILRIATLFFLSPSLWGQQNEFTPLNLGYIRDQISEANSNAIAVGPKDLMYVGGQGALYVFAQKNRIQQIAWDSITNGSQNAFNECVILCNTGDFLLAADKGGLGKVDGKTFRADIIETKINVTHIASVKHNEAFILKKDILLKYNGSKLSVVTEAKNWCAIVSIDTILLGSDGANLFEIKENQQKKIISCQLTPNEKIVNLFKADENTVVILTNQNRLILFSPSGSSPQSLPTSIKLDTTWKVQSIKILEDRIYIATLYHGLFFYEKSRSTPTPVHIKTESGRPLKYILSLEATEDNVLFIGTRGGGMLSYSPERERIFTPFFPQIEDKKVTDFHDFSIRSTFAVDTNSVFFGTDEGRVFLFLRGKNGKKITKDTGIKLPQGKSRTQVRSLWVTKDHIYVGTGVDAAEIYQYARNGTIENDRKAIKTFEKQISSLWLDGSRMYVGTPKGLFSFDIKNNVKNTVTEIQDSTIRSIVKLNGQIYATGNDGNLWKKDSSGKFKRLNSITRNDITYITHFDDSTFCIFTRGDFLQIVTIKGNKVTPIKGFTEKNGLIGVDGAPANVIYGGYFDSHNTLWALTDKGLFCKREHDDYFYRFTPEILGLPDNPDGNTGAFCRLGSDLIMGFRTGCVLINTEEFHNYKIKRKIIMLERLSDGNYQVKDSGDDFSMNKNFSSIDLVSFDLENVFGGARPLLVDYYANGDTTKKTYTLSSGQDFLIMPDSFSYILGFVGWGSNTYFFENSKYLIPFHEETKSWMALFGLILFGGALVLLVKTLLQKKVTKEKAAREKAEDEKRIIKEQAAREKAESDIRIIEEQAAKEKAQSEKQVTEEKAAREKAESDKRIAEEKAAREKAEAEERIAKIQAKDTEAQAEKAKAKAKQAEAEAAKANIEAQSLNYRLSLSNKALGQHFFKNNIELVEPKQAYLNERYNLSLLKEIFAIFPEHKVLIEKIEKGMNRSKGFMIKIPNLIINYVEKLEPEKKGRLSLLEEYAQLLERLNIDIKNATKSKDLFIGYYKHLVSTSTRTTILKDATLIESVCKLYTKNPDYKWIKYEGQNNDFSEGGVIEIVSNGIENFKNCEIPFLLVQPLVENVRNYGETDNRVLKIRYEYHFDKKDHKHLAIISVINNGTWNPSITASHIPSGTDGKSERSMDIIKKTLQQEGGRLFEPQKIVRNGRNFVVVKFEIPITFNIEQHG
jgi:hypothetical protein